MRMVTYRIRTKDNRKEYYCSFNNGEQQWRGILRDATTWTSYSYAYYALCSLGKSNWEIIVLRDRTPTPPPTGSDNGNGWVIRKWRN